MDKLKILKILLVSIVIIFICVLGSKIISNNNSYSINIKYVDEIDSEIYDLIYFYDYNEITSQYDIKQIKVLKNNNLHSIFNYYNMDLKYKLNSITKIEEVITINLDDGDRELDMNLIRVMKLSFSCVEVKKVIINYNNKQYVV